MHRATPFNTSLRSYTAGGARSVVESVDDSKLMQEAKGNFAKGETRDSIESPQNYGFSSVCADGEKDKQGNLTMGPETFVSFPGGNRSFPAYGAMDDRRHRLKDLGKDAAKGATSMFGLKEWGQQFLNTDTGMFMTGNTEKKMRFQLVENQNGKKQQQQPNSRISPQGWLEPVTFRSRSGVEFEIEVTPYADGASGGSGSGQGQQAEGSKPTGQKTLHKEESSTFVDMTKEQVHTKRGNGNVRAEDSKTMTFHGSENMSTKCDQTHVHIQGGGDKIWVVPGACLATKPIEIADCGDGGTTKTFPTPPPGPDGRLGPSLTSTFNNAQASSRMRFWIVRHLNSFGVENCHVDGMDFTTLEANIEIVEWKEGMGEVEYNDRPKLRETITDVTPFAPFFDQFIAKLPYITLAQAKKIKCDLISLLYDNKRQLPYAYNVAAGNFTWDATDQSVLGMTTATIPSLISILVGTSDSTVVGKINTLADQINANIVAPGNQTIGQINSNIVTPGNNGFVTIDSVFGQVNSGVVDPTNATFTQINNQIVSPGNALRYHLDDTVLGVFTGSYNVNCINDKLRGTGAEASVAAPGLTADIPKSNVTFTLIGVSLSAIGSNPYRLAAITTNFLNVSHASTTPDPSIPQIQWTPIGQANPVNLTATEMSGIMSGIANRQKSLMTTRFNKTAAVNALADIAAVIAYDVSTGWPS
jgi:phage gp45-like